MDTTQAKCFFCKTEYAGKFDYLDKPICCDCSFRSSNELKDIELTEGIRRKLLDDIEFKELNLWLIKTGRIPNPYPIGTRAVYVFAKGTEKISNAHKWELFVFLNK